MEEPRQLGWGEQAPSFRAAALNGAPDYAFDTTAGRHIILLFYGTGTYAAARTALEVVGRHRSLFDDEGACFFGITTDPRDAAAGLIAQQLPGIRFFLDYGREVSRLYGALSDRNYRPHWLLLDPTLRVLGRFPIEQGEAAMELLRTCVSKPAMDDQWAPVLLVPNVFELALCEELISLYGALGGKPSGFMREVNGETVLVTDPDHKQRKDCLIEDEKLRDSIAARIVTRLQPPLKRAFQFSPTRMERYLVACYEAGAGHFRPHRDNTTKGTAHRKFAVSINLNSSDYDGGDLRFPEYSRRSYRPPSGGAIVFSCSLLHEATPVTRGTRYAFLPFLYDEEGARIREQNDRYLQEKTGYRASSAS
jgi:predicted 2-oxoglutarate/Fe(II)-dependent dioxygenase YbiX/peroxiredoxin